MSSRKFRKYVVYVNRLDPKEFRSDSDLENCFRTFHCDSCKIKVTKNKWNYGFVNFSRLEDSHKAIDAMNSVRIGRFNLEVKFKSQDENVTLKYRKRINQRINPSTSRDSSGDYDTNDNSRNRSSDYDTFDNSRNRNFEYNKYDRRDGNKKNSGRFSPHHQISPKGRIDNSRNNVFHGGGNNDNGRNLRNRSSDYDTYDNSRNRNCEYNKYDRRDGNKKNSGRFSPNHQFSPKGRIDNSGNNVFHGGGNNDNGRNSPQTFNNFSNDRKSRNRQDCDEKNFKKNLPPPNSQIKEYCDSHEKDGNCGDGDNCKYVHRSVMNGSPFSVGKKRILCKYFSTGCNRGESCYMMHIGPVGKSSAIGEVSGICRFFNSSTGCNNKEPCKFKHVQIPESEKKVIVLVGITGVGKSALGNVLLEQNAFRESCSGESETRHVCKKHSYKCEVVDTIGLGDTEIPKIDIQNRLSDVFYETKNGINALCYLFDGRMREDVLKAFLDIIKILGVDILPRLMIVRTNYPKFDKHRNVIKDEKEKIMEKFNGHLSPFGFVVEEENIVLLNNPSKDDNEKDWLDIRKKSHQKFWDAIESPNYSERLVPKTWKSEEMKENTILKEGEIEAERRSSEACKNIEVKEQSIKRRREERECSLKNIYAKFENFEVGKEYVKAVEHPLLEERESEYKRVYREDERNEKERRKREIERMRMEEKKRVIEKRRKEKRRLEIEERRMEKERLRREYLKAELKEKEKRRREEEERLSLLKIKEIRENDVKEIRERRAKNIRSIASKACLAVGIGTVTALITPVSPVVAIIAGLGGIIKIGESTGDCNVM